MNYKAETQTWMPMEIRGIPGYFTDMRIDRDTVPGLFHVWELADDNDGIPCRYKPGIMVNFFGTFLTTGGLPIDSKEQTEGFLSHDGDWSFTEDRYIPFCEVLCRETEKKMKDNGSPSAVS